GGGGGGGWGPRAGDASRPRADWHTITADIVVRRLETSVATGLETEEAAARLARFGDNRLPEPRPKSALEIITGHVMSVPVLVLGVAATLSVVSGAFLAPGGIVAVIGSNALGVCLPQRGGWRGVALSATVRRRAAVC